MSLTDRERKPHTAKPQNGATGAWWYEDSTGITVYVHNGVSTSACRITRRVLADWLARTRSDKDQS